MVWARAWHSHLARDIRSTGRSLTYPLSGRAGLPAHMDAR